MLPNPSIDRGGGNVLRSSLPGLRSYGHEKSRRKYSSLPDNTE